MSLPVSLADWLALREPADHAARSASLTERLARSLAPAWTRPLRIVDLGTGRGSNVRYLAQFFPIAQWLLVDEDETVLSAAATVLEHSAGPALAIAGDGHSLSIPPAFSAPSAVIESLWSVETRRLNLGARDESVIAGRDLVTASALLDLVSPDWIEWLAGACRTAGACALFALTYTGRSRCSPREPEDDLLCELLNRHQRGSDKGFGRAAGPDAVECAVRAFAQHGFRVERAASDWTLSAGTRELQRQLVVGWAVAGREIAPDRVATIDAWLTRRLTHIDAGESEIVVSHEDFAAWPQELPTSNFTSDFTLQTSDF